MEEWIEKFGSPVDLNSSSVAVSEVICVRSAEIGLVPISVIVTVEPRIEYFRNNEKEIKRAARNS